MTNSISFKISPQEALILEMSLKECKNRDLLLEVGRCLVTKQDTVLSLGEKDFWFLRDKIDPNVQVGTTSGIDLIIRIYKVLLVGHKRVISQDELRKLFGKTGIEGFDYDHEASTRTDKDQATGIA